VTDQLSKRKEAGAYGWARPFVKRKTPPTLR
jgi:hypothetical protein